MDNIEKVLKRLENAKEVCYDCETSGLSWQRNHIVGHVFSFGPHDDDSYYLPVRHATGGNIAGCTVPDTATGWDGSVHPLEAELIKLLDRQGLHVFGHNLHFDLKFLFRIGFNKFDATFEDTMLNATLINEWQSSFSLDYCCRVNKVEPKKTNIYQYIVDRFPGSTLKNAMGYFWQLRGDDPIAVDYAAGDGVSTWQLRHNQRVELALQNLSLVQSVECRLIPVLARMMTRGVNIDGDRLEWLKGEVERRRQVALQSLPEGFNSRSPVQVRALMEKNGFTDWPLTPKGAPSFPEQWLIRNPVGNNIIDVRKLSNLNASFFGPMSETHLWRGHCHPEYNQLRGDEYGTITGRLSSSNPNLQQVNKRNEKLGRLHRSIFIPERGMIWGSADYSQMEPRLLAYYARCKVLMEGYKATPPIDAHSAVAKVADIDRDTGKRVNQTLITGGGKKVLTTKYGIPPDKVDDIWDKYFEAMPEIKIIQKTSARRMRDRGYVMSLLGRRARLNDPNKDYVALNRLLQGGNADCIKLKMVEIDDFLRSEGDKVHLLNNVHDSLDFQFHPQDEPIYKEALRIMTAFGPQDVIHLDVPIEVDAKTGKDWAEATYGPEQVDGTH